ncbi:hypothetical protein FNV43_RR12836 [Rhamnella rubrinervis]|uniref:Uncharacterized protein n=1 Tax=Rhamnella rubrinervis TaxID=2594499 RepID=A0A8K0MIN8_9ROSA|nr:hypothetical protein FNV43_RR12836 [Rhamnella rubrinervis]
MGRGESLSFAVRQLKRAVKKVKLILLGLKWRRYWRLIITNTKSGADKMRRYWSFNDRLEFYGCFEDEKSDEKRTSKRLQRTRSYSEDRDNDRDIDQRAEVFIDNFRYQLLLERQVSWKLRYWQEHSSNMEDEGSSSL